MLSYGRESREGNKRFSTSEHRFGTPKQRLKPGVVLTTSLDGDGAGSDKFPERPVRVACWLWEAAGLRRANPFRGEGQQCGKLVLGWERVLSAMSGPSQLPRSSQLRGGFTQKPVAQSMRADRPLR